MIYSQMSEKDDRIATFSYDGGVVLRPQFARPLCGYGGDGSIDASKQLSCPRGRTRRCLPGCGVVAGASPQGAGPDWCSRANPHDEGAWLLCGIQWSRSGMRPWHPSEFVGEGGLLDLFATYGSRFQGVGTGQKQGGEDEKSFKGYDEIVVDSEPWLANLPWSVEAIFYVECPNGRGETNLKYSDQPTKALTCGDAEDKAREMHAAFLRAYPEIDPAAFPLQRLRTDNWERPFENA